ncbi:serine/threonine protein kinase ATG1 KNAG_0G01250 [Huiozyma naganishii CBS 8797]|uniref:Serine/threonine-protein kinase ATG1 n=1 Tax=Huiozyma naganishii (strain ATCC MYA-139 / BCRC 22969 / CBS 8797 / KCTC 17520 / NBRC 10181 / NCYC 3082 / Yp74L-3) TaxID=1071383 RepID=J7RNP0_HUIN7|nr:hypothetical protein KNAG_0G01250 [Kazachstania naganishii CBS 8797]CCK71183.1 hypothetical protein KNAG_0G01250 [Kazachstania naganishii CBS 8797]
MASDAQKTVPVIPGGVYVVEKEIGKGSFAVVYRGHFARDAHRQIAIKAVSRSKLKNRKLLENLEVEIAILKKIKHPHIVGLVDCERTGTDFYLIMEYCALGDLTFLIKKRKELVKNHPLLRKVFEKYPPPNENRNGLHSAFILNYLQQLACSLKFLRSKNLVHRDIKPQNLLLSTPLLDYTDPASFHKLGYIGIYNLPILKIADFGFARFLPSSSLAETLCGSPLYMAPEILNYQKYNAKADLWSVGTVLYEMCCGHPPFKASNHLELFKKIKRANNVINFPEYFTTGDTQLDEDLKSLICQLLTFDPQDRTSFDTFFDNKLVNMDLSCYELVDDISVELENRSKDIRESNMFISEYLPTAHKHDHRTALPQQQITPTAAEVAAKGNVKTNPTKPVRTPSLLATDKRMVRPTVQHKTQSTNSDLMLEKEYVVIEKKTVEINELADEIAHIGTADTATTAINVNNAVRGSPVANRPLERTPKVQRSPKHAASRRASSVDRRVSISSLNPSNALSRALGIASTRLFGTTGGHSGIPDSLAKSPHEQAPRSLLSAQLFQDLTENIVLKTEEAQQGEPSAENGIIKDRDTIVHFLELLAAKAFVVYSYAEVKFAQIVPLQGELNKRLSTGSCAVEEEECDDTIDDGLRNRANGQRRSNSRSSSNLMQLNTDLVMNEGSALVCKEAITLYLKSLELLGYSMQITSNWWYNSNENVCSLRLNLLVQWVRERFNECLEKAEFLRLKLFECDNEGMGKAETVHTTEAQDHQPTQEDKDNEVFVEKLLYDRALEISKSAAKMELNGDNLNGCELSYATSIWMLQTALDNESSASLLDEQDRKVIKKYINSIRNRLQSLRQKLSRNS